MRPKRLGRTTVYESPWINLHLDEVRLPSGAVIDQYHVLDFPREAVGSVVTNEQDEILLVNAYRYTTDSLGWEVPAGRIDEGESILEAAQREVLEETGYHSRGHAHIYSFNPSNGMSNQVCHLVRCRATTATGRFDQDEVQEYRWFSRQELMSMVVHREIWDAFTLIGLLLAVNVPLLSDHDRS